MTFVIFIFQCISMYSISGFADVGNDYRCGWNNDRGRSMEKRSETYGHQVYRQREEDPVANHNLMVVEKVGHGLLGVGESPLDEEVVLVIVDG